MRKWSLAWVMSFRSLAKSNQLFHWSLLMFPENSIKIPSKLFELFFSQPDKLTDNRRTLELRWRREKEKKETIFLYFIWFQRYNINWQITGDDYISYNLFNFVGGGQKKRKKQYSKPYSFISSDFRDSVQKLDYLITK